MIRNDDVISMKDIVGKWTEADMSKEKGKKENSPNSEEGIRKKFVYILEKKLGLSQEEIGWFKRKLANGREQFVFQNGEWTHFDLKKILDICGRNSVAITPSEEYSLIEYFERILPSPMLEGDIRACNDTFNVRMYRIDQAVHDFCRNSRVNDLYMNKLFVKKSAKLEPNKEKRREFYKDQYAQIKRWNEKWMFVMQNASGIRKAERAECLYRCQKDGIFGCIGEDEENFCKVGKSENEMIQREYKKMRKIRSQDLYQYALWLFITGYQEKKQTDEVVQEDIRNMEGCIKACTSLFNKVITHQLKKDSIEDYEYIINEAIEEVVKIKIILQQNCEADERRKKSLYPEMEILKRKNRFPNMKVCTEKDLQNLSSIRRYLNEIRNERILITDYI